ncbi:GLUG motif-containing protein [Vallitalea sp.]|jgi:hypothetical protein|uniref:GLUG motif-containing protein n=1 Tax=Vallitalea sp. TaxID=1882829 RepID=UPI0025EA03E0|nr:GLUG motif-containing protein [Vallitalea sp.]MCT4687935.1 S-layer homology domain-containing protein [Vallitalea sp.]
MKQKNKWKKIILSQTIMALLLVTFFGTNVEALKDEGSSVDVWNGTVASGYASGSGTEEDPYVISTAAELAYSAQDISNKCVKLIKDIDLNNIEWAPSKFRGSFDGQEHVIRNIKIRKSNQQRIGFFETVVPDKIIKNLGLENIDYVIDPTKNSSFIELGGFVGHNKGEIKNCYVKGGTINIDIPEGNTDNVTSSAIIGGFASSNINTIENCYSNININISKLNNLAVGLFIGKTDNFMGKDYKINYCYAVGTIQYESAISINNISSFVAMNSGKLGECFYDKTILETSPNQITKLEKDTSIGKTTEEMQDEATYANWDTNIWHFKLGNYPSLIEFEVIENEFEGGKGTQEDPYQIKTIEQLKKIENHNEQSTHFILVDNIELSANPNWEPLCKEYNKGFKGVFDGNNKTIIGLDISTTVLPDKTNEPIGLFSKIEGGTVKYLTIEADINVLNSKYVGALAGQMLGGTVENVHITNSSLTAEISDGIGGMIGIIGQRPIGGDTPDGTLGNTEIINCYADAVVSGKVFVGGLIGRIIDNVGTQVNKDIKLSYAKGKVTASSSNAGGLIGGIADKNSNVEGCFSMSDITSKVGYAGGLIGANNGGIISYSYATGKVIGENGKDTVLIGGLVGNMSNGELNNSYAIGKVEGNRKIGGLAGGAMGGTITNCFASGDVTSLQDGESNALIGLKANGTLTNCYYYKGQIITGKDSNNYGTEATIAHLHDKTWYSSLDKLNWNTDKWLIDTKVDNKYYPHIKKTTSEVLQGQVDISLPLEKKVFEGGSGTQADPYQIKTIQQLKQIKDYNKQGTHFKLLDNIDLASEGDWNPLVQNSDKGFQGLLDGNNKTITGLKIDVTASEENKAVPVGLFSKIEGGTIKNLNVQANINVPNSTYVGALAGQVLGGTIENVHVTETTITANISIGVGGIIGVVGHKSMMAEDGTDGDTTITSCSSHATVNGKQFVGGLIGHISMIRQGEPAIRTIEYSYSTGNVSNSGDVVGGLIGRNADGNIDSCFATGTVNSEKGIAGGLIGTNIGEINNCYAVGNIIGNDKTSAFIGGLIGSNNGNISNCYALGNVKGHYAVGGLIGKGRNGNVTNCFLVGDIESTQENKANKLVGDKNIDLHIANCYYYKEQKVIGEDNNNYGKEVTTDDLHDKTWYTSSDKLKWNTDKWLIDDKIDNSFYPHIKKSSQILSGQKNIPLPKKDNDQGQENNGNNNGNSSENNDNSDDSSYTPSSDKKTKQTAYVNGKKEVVGKTKLSSNKKEVKIELDEKLVDNILSKSKKQSVIILPTIESADKMEGHLNGRLVNKMDKKETILEIATKKAKYKLPTKEIKINEVAKKLGKNIPLEKIKVEVSINKTSQDMVKVIENTTKKSSFSLVVPPVDFEITCTYNNKTVEVTKFNTYVERMIAIPKGIDPSKITTAIISYKDGSTCHVPTKITIIDGKYYAKINSLTNSTYSVVYNPKKYSDVKGHLAEDICNEMGARMIVEEKSATTFCPDEKITRAFLTQTIVRALGLGDKGQKVTFDDISKDEEQFGIFATAYEYGIIKGYSDQTFKPNQLITREEAIAMIVRAMKIIGYKIDYTQDEIKETIDQLEDKDKISSWATESIGIYLNSELTQEQVIDIFPKQYISKAEIAVIVKRLLNKANLI